MSDPATHLDWSTLDPLLIGPYRKPRDRDPATFLVPAPRADPTWRICRLRSGPAWPGELPALDRLAAVPAGRAEAEPGAATVLLSEDDTGHRNPVCWRAPDGRVSWAVDPARWIEGILAERYVTRWSRPLPSLLPLLNYNVVPSALKGALQPTGRLDAAHSNETPFPRVPLDDLVESLRALCASLAFGGSPERRTLWPEGRRAALTVCHDVDTRWILEPAQRALLTALLEVHAELGIAGAWYVVARQLHRRRHAEAIDAILAAGHELGIHGWNHDAKLDYLSEPRQSARMRKARERFEGLGATGVRTPWYGRSARLMGVLGRHFEYSSSAPNASAFFSEGCNSGCCTVFPYRSAGGLVELPLTLPPDTAGDRESVYEWMARSADAIVAHGGVIVVTLHPQPHQSGTPEGVAAHAAFLRALDARHGAALWKARPGEIAARYCESLGLPFPAHPAPPAERVA